MTTEAGKTEQVVEEHAIEPVADTAAPEAAQYERDLAGDTAGADDAPQGGRQSIRSQVNRLAIGEKFNKQREDAEEQIGFTGSHADLTTLAGKLTQEQPDEEPPEADAPAQAAEPAADTTPAADAPRKFKVKVRHEERELSEDELVAAAQKTLAADDYLGEARSLLEEAKRTAASRPHQDVQPPATTEQTGDQADPPHQEDEARTIAERIQFGTTEEATEGVRNLLTKKALDPDDVRKVIYDDRRNGDLEVSTRAYEAFSKDNAALFKDPLTRAALNEQYLELVREDLRGIGYDDDRIPKTVDELREHHRFHRIHGKKVRDTAALLADSKQAVETWKSGSTPNLNPERQPGTVAVNVDRTERRQSIPHQPARAAVPPQAVTSPAKTQSVRRDAVNDILGKRRRVVIT